MAFNICRTILPANTYRQHDEGYLIKELIMSRKTVVSFFLCMFLCAGFAAAQQPGEEKAAVTAAEKWLNLVDSGKYAESWNEAAGYFRNAVKQDQWKQSMRAFRKPLGEVISRRIMSKQYQTSLPGAPDAEYVIIRFETSFENKKSAVETVTPMMDKDGKWRVAGYYIK
jgi:hypothetical protein